jgi:hypothetical protein
MLSSILVPIPPMELMESPRKSLQIKRELVKADIMQRMSSVLNLGVQSSSGAGLVVPAADNLEEFLPLNPISRASPVKLVSPSDFLTAAVVNEVQTRDVVEREVSTRDPPKCESSGVMVGSTVCPIPMVSVSANQVLGETQGRKNIPRKKVVGPMATGLGPWSQILAWEEYPHIPSGWMWIPKGCVDFRLGFPTQPIEIYKLGRQACHIKIPSATVPFDRSFVEVVGTEEMNRGRDMPRGGAPPRDDSRKRGLERDREEEREWEEQERRRREELWKEEDLRNKLE